MHKRLLALGIVALPFGCGQQIDPGAGANATPQSVAVSELDEPESRADPATDDRGSDQQPGPVVSDDPDAIAKVRKQFEEDLNLAFADGMAQVRKGDWVDSDARWALERRKPQALSELRRIMNDEAEPDRARAQAAHMLLSLGDAAGEPFLLEALSSPRAGLRAAALKMLGEFDVRTDLKRADRAAMVLARVDDSDPEVTRQAVFLSANRKLPGAETAFVRLLRSGRAKDPKLVARELAAVAESPEAVDLAVDGILRDRPSKYDQWIGFALARLVDHPNPRVSAPVRNALRAYLLAFRGEARYDQSLAGDLAKVADASCTRALEEIATHAKDPVSRARAQEGLARLDPEHAVERLLRFIRDERAPWMVRPLANYVTERDADRVLAALLDPGNGPRPATVSLETTQLLVERLGARGRTAVEGAWERLEPSA